MHCMPLAFYLISKAHKTQSPAILWAFFHRLFTWSVWWLLQLESLNSTQHTTNLDFGLFWQTLHDITELNSAELVMTTSPGTVSRGWGQRAGYSRRSSWPATRLCPRGSQPEGCPPSWKEVRPLGTAWPCPHRECSRKGLGGRPSGSRDNLLAMITFCITAALLQHWIGAAPMLMKLEKVC